MIKYRNPKYIKDGRIDCEVEHPDYGWIPFTADPNDTEQLGRDLFHFIKAKDTPKPYTTPNESEVLAEKRQTTVVPLDTLLGNMVEQGWISEVAAESWISRKSLPQPVVTQISNLTSAKDRIKVRSTFMDSSVWRNDPLWVAALGKFSKTEDEIDAVFGIV